MTNFQFSILDSKRNVTGVGIGIQRIFRRDWLVIHLGALDIALAGSWSYSTSADIIKQGQITLEREAHITHSTITVLGYDNLSYAVQVIVVIILINLIVLRTVDEANYISILLYGT